MIFYYTATGNSLYVARCVEKEPLSIPQELKKNSLVYQDEMIGIVAPVYAGELPLTVQKFIERATFQTDYFYLLLTYGNHDSIAGIWSQQFCQKQGIDVQLIQTVHMVDNYLPSFDMNEQKKLKHAVPQQMQRILSLLQQRACTIPQPTQEGRQLYQKVHKKFQEFPYLHNGQLISMTDRCVGCTICQQVCPIGNIVIRNQKAQRLFTTCDFCLACVHHCPFQAIDLKGEKNSQARYRHPQVSLKDIVNSNHQGGKQQ